MTRAVLPNPSAWAEWLLAGIVDRALHQWGHVLPLDGGFVDHDHADSETDTAIPDDDDDIASFPSQPSASLRPSSFELLASAFTEQFASALAMMCQGDFVLGVPRVTFSLTLSSKTTVYSGWPSTRCSHSSGRPTGGAFQQNSFSQHCRGTTGGNALTSYVTLPLLLIFFSTVHSFALSFWISQVVRKGRQ